MKMRNAKNTLSKKRFFNYAYLVVFSLLINGCVGINLTPKEVAFELPSKYFDISVQKDDLNSDEKILLKFKKAQNNVLKYEENTTVFAKVENGKGIEVTLTKKTEQFFGNYPENNSWNIITSSVIQNIPEQKSTENYIMDDKGRILKFISAEHISENGKIKILEWKRDKIFPDNPVKPGDKWSYEEFIKIELNSFWVSRKNDAPYKVKAKCEFANFAVVNGRKCAVIKTRAVEHRNEVLSTFFKKMELNINSFINEIAFFDYENGMFIGRIIGTETFTMSKDYSFSDHSISQTIWKVSD